MKPELAIWPSLIGILLLSSQSYATARLQIITTILPLTAHTLSICGDRATVHQLVPPNVGLHDYHPKPSDLRKLHNADLIFINGIQLEPWIEDYTRSAKKTISIIDTSRGIQTLDDHDLALEGCTHSHADDGGAARHHHHHGPNPHVWLDPLLAKQQAENILKALIEKDPDNKSYYQTRAATYFARLEKLHKDFQNALAPLKKKTLLTFHNSFLYFAKRYHIRYLGFVEQLPHQSPSPKRVARLIEIIRQNQVQVIFTEVGYPPKLLETLSRETRTRIASLDTIETGKPHPDAYIDAMENNLRVLKKAWQ